MAPNFSKAKEKSGKAGSFQSILKSRLEKIQPVQNTGDLEQPASGTHEAWNTVEDAARLLDEAMEHIQKDGYPSPHTIHALQELRGQLKQNRDNKGSTEEVDAIIAAETSRLQTWDN